MLRVYNLGPNGALTETQWNEVEKRPQGGSFRPLDANHDGKLTRAELSSGKERDAVVNNLFNRVDKNRDGFASMDEGRPSRLDQAPQAR